MQNFKIIKNEIRIVAFDDGPFKLSEEKDILIGVIFRGGQFMDGLVKADIEVDGLDAQDEIIRMMKKTRHKDLRIIMLDGITFAGFNIVNIKEIYRKTGLPVIVVNRKEPDFDRFKRSMKKFSEYERRLKCVEDAGPVYWARINNKRVCFQCSGIKTSDAEEIIRISATRSLIPEPLRVAHLIAGGMILGESIGRA